MEGPFLSAWSDVAKPRTALSSRGGQGFAVPVRFARTAHEVARNDRNWPFRPARPQAHGIHAAAAAILMLSFEESEAAHEGNDRAAAAARCSAGVPFAYGAGAGRAACGSGFGAIAVAGASHAATRGTAPGAARRDFPDRA